MAASVRLKSTACATPRHRWPRTGEIRHEESKHIDAKIAALDGDTRRAIDIHAGEQLDAAAFKALIYVAVALHTVPRHSGAPPEKLSVRLARPCRAPDRCLRHQISRLFTGAGRCVRRAWRNGVLSRALAKLHGVVAGAAAKLRECFQRVVTAMRAARMAGSVAFPR